MTKDNQYLIALDAGGTMTDTFLMDVNGAFTLGKALTQRAEEWRSYLDSVQDAASSWGMTSLSAHKSASLILYTGTTMLNTILTRTGKKVGMLVTRGFKDLPLQERGLTWLGQAYDDVLHQVLHEHTPWLMDPRNVMEVSERISSGSIYIGQHYPPGTVIIPMSEDDVRKGVNALLDEGVEAIGIIFIFSFIEPKHEIRAKEIAQEIVKSRGLNVPVEISYDLCPTEGESSRFKDLLFQCFAADHVRQQLVKIESAAQEEGYSHKLYTLASYGGAVSVRYPRLFETVVSGPVGGVIGAHFLAEHALGKKNVMCLDLGGTTYDMGLIVGGYMGLNENPDFAGHRLKLPMVSLNSMGAGTGQVIHIDPRFKRISLGPESAGSRVGTCYQYPDPTIGDLDLALGYLSPDYFLGGKVKLNKDRAMKELEERVAKPLGKDVYQSAIGILDMLHTGMALQMRSLLLARGYNAKEFTNLFYGGSGPLHLWGVADLVEAGANCTVPWAAAFSAFGVAAAEHVHRYHKSVIVIDPAGVPGEFRIGEGQKLNKAWEELEQKAYQELSDVPRNKIRFRHGIYARYIGQLDNWEAEVPVSRVKTALDMDKVIGGFEKVYTTIYPQGARFPEAGYSITEVFIEAYVAKVKPVIKKYELEGKNPSNKAFKGQRDVCHKGKWGKWDVWEMDLLKAGNHLDGPAIIEHPMTTMPVPPGRHIDIDEHLVFWYT